VNDRQPRSTEGVGDGVDVGEIGSGVGGAQQPLPAPGPANSADDEIVRLVTTDAHPHPEEILVATSDRNLSDRVRAAGAAVYPAERLRNLIDPD
jgi:hypothetical protein